MTEYTGYFLPSGKGAVSTDYSNTPYYERYKDQVITDRSTLSRLPGGYQYYRFAEREGDPKPAPAPDGSLVKYETYSAMKFNLPPHEWSLPVDHVGVTPMSISAMGAVGRDEYTNEYAGKATDHAHRRAMMWYYGGADTTAGANLIMPPSSSASQTPKDKLAASTAKDNFWGFQFLWNPQNLQNSLTRNANVVPSALDEFGALSSLFTAMEQLQFTIVIDRINDFACARAVYDISKNTGALGEDFAKYYKKGGNPGVPQAFVEQFKDLMDRGTMADVEYIYKMINGSGQAGKVWVNGLGRKTADLGFLSPTAVALRFGPNPDSLSYVGWVESLSVNHTVFTQDMIPLHTEVSVSFNAFSRVSLTSGN